MRTIIPAALVLLVFGVGFHACQREEGVRTFKEVRDLPSSGVPDTRPALPPDHPPLPGSSPEAAEAADGRAALPPDHPPIGQAVPDGREEQRLRSSLAWNVPPGWIEGRAEGMRLGSLRIPGGQAGDAECSLISLAGAAGGLEANVTRWLGQLGLTLDRQALTAFLTSKPALSTAAGKPLHLLDFTALTGREARTSMLVGVVDLGPARLFVKCTGQGGLLGGQLQAFTELCRSVRGGEAP
ncbi:MAG: hypothetical protein A2284_14055 [Deltaproteobacteria bacterium RIFOXYA12_FULL_61_11]|nr:MAG: hypothetical protein A2284_14055 [Deltaproteobacteria bacterium RIFOXYA12_FULL_61_11]